MAAGVAAHQGAGLEFPSGAVVVSDRQSDHVAARNCMQIDLSLLQQHQQRRDVIRFD